MKRDYSYPLRVAADKYPKRTILTYRDETWTYRDFDRATDGLAAAFEERGLTGRRVVALMQNEPVTVMAMLALARAGAVAVPVNPRLLADEVAFIAGDCDASALISDGAFAATVDGLEVAQRFSVHGGDGEPLEDLLHREAAPATEVDSALAAR